MLKIHTVNCGTLKISIYFMILQSINSGQLRNPGSKSCAKETQCFESIFNRLNIPGVLAGIAPFLSSRNIRPVQMLIFTA